VTGPWAMPVSASADAKGMPTERLSMMNLEIRNRNNLESLEEQVLSPWAARSSLAGATRLFAEPEHPYRTAFQRDRDRIVHSRAFRRLKHKRQVFLTRSGDHYRTRITHTMEVAQLSRTMARALGGNEDLTEAVALGHDLGHTPFGHVGEVVLHKILCGDDDLDGLLPSGQNVGGYKHNYQSVRVVDVLENKYQWPGLNLTAAVREGLLKHTRLRRQILSYPDFNLLGLHYDADHATTLEGQIVAVCDEIAQRTHDLEDGIRAHYVTADKVRQLSLIQKVESGLDFTAATLAEETLWRNQMIRGLVNFLVTDVLEETVRRARVFQEEKGRCDNLDSLLAWFSDPIHPLQEELDHFINRHIIRVAVEHHRDDQAIKIIRTLFKVYYLQPHLLPPSGLRAKQENDESQFLRIICDHIAGMTDHFAEIEFQRIESMIDES
jgi:dGTPase